MTVFERWLLVGGTGRNIGKTTASVDFIRKLSLHVPVVGVKISNTLPGNLSFHGDHLIDPDQPYVILEEKNSAGNKDSMRFLKAGARRSYFIVSQDAYLVQVLSALNDMLLPDEWVVCESNGLRRLINPGLFVMIKGTESPNSKKNLDFLLQEADYTLPALNSKALQEFTDRLNIREDKFEIR